MYCPKCGTDNDEDAKYCEGCGQSLQKDIHRRNIVAKNQGESGGISSNVKILIVICVALIAILGVTAGMLIQKPQETITTPQVNTTGTSNQQTNTQTYLPTWHKVAVYTGPGEDYGSFTITGNQFKVTMSATPSITYNRNYLDVYVYKGNTIGANLVNSGSLSWSETEDPIKKETSIIVPQGSGTYTLDILPVDIDNYAVTVWDYY